MTCPERRPRPAFTLVEMLVVIAIIGILAAILIPTLWGVMVRTRESRIVMDMSHLANAFETYKQKYGDYPPDFSEVAAVQAGDMTRENTVLYRHIMKVFPQIDQTVELENFFQNIAPNLDPAEAIVFWLGGFSTDRSNPFTGPNGPLSGDRTEPLIEFDETRVRFSQDPSTTWVYGDPNDPFPVYVPPGRDQPYVYFDARTYETRINPQVVYYAHYFHTAISGVARPYKSTQRTPEATSLNLHATHPNAYFYVNRNTFQIISAGMDGNYGDEPPLATVANEPIRWQFPTGQALHSNDAISGGSYRYVDATGLVYGGRGDNVANFSEGTLENKLP